MWDGNQNHKITPLPAGTPTHNVTKLNPWLQPIHIQFLNLQWKEHLECAQSQWKPSEEKQIKWCSQILVFYVSIFVAQHLLMLCFWCVVFFFTVGDQLSIKQMFSASGFSVDKVLYRWFSFLSLAKSNQVLYTDEGWVNSSTSQWNCKVHTTSKSEQIPANSRLLAYISFIIASWLRTYNI